MRIEKTVPLILAVVLSLGAGAGAFARTIYFGTVAEFAPYNMLDDNGTVQGFEAQLQQRLCARENLDCAWVPVPRSDLARALQSGDIDVILSAYRITAAHKIYFDLTESYLPSAPGAILIRGHSGPPPAGSRVGALQGSAAADQVLKNGWSLVTYTTPTDAIAALKSGAISAYLGDKAHLKSVLKTASGEGLHLAKKEIPLDGGLAMAVRRASPGLLAVLNAGIRSLKADGTLDQLIAHWFVAQKAEVQDAGN